MLTREDNDLLCRVGPGTPMGTLLRQYWHPVLLSTELPAPNCDPLRVRLLGEDLIAFRDSSGRVGMLASNCSHRGASLFFGRNEEDGLRCVYHGWKYDVSGRCVDMPNERSEAERPRDSTSEVWSGDGRQMPPESDFKDRIRHLAYACEERGGVIWTYMGQPTGLALRQGQTGPGVGGGHQAAAPRPAAGPARPPLPELPWFLVPEGQRFFTKRLQENNFVQAIEGGIDTTHASFLHTRLTLDMALKQEKDPKTNRTWGDDQRTNQGLAYAMSNRYARFEMVDTDYGIMIASRREAGEDATYWRINQFLFPYYTMPPGHAVVDRQTPKGGGGGHAFVPIDDEHTISWSFTANFYEPFTDTQLEQMLEYPNPGLHAGVPGGLLPPTSAPMGAFRPIHNARNDYGLDYELQRTGQFCGIPDRSTQDNAVQESMGPIYDRMHEHLGVSDSGVVRMRRRLLEAAKALRDAGATPPGVDTPHAYLTGACGFVLPKGEPWIDTAHELCGLDAELGVQVNVSTPGGAAFRPVGEGLVPSRPASLDGGHAAGDEPRPYPNDGFPLAPSGEREG